MRFSHESNMRNSRLPHCASIFSSRNTAAAFSSSTLPENSLSATPTRKLKSCSRRMSRRQRRIARRKSPVYQPCDLISSLKNTALRRRARPSHHLSTRVGSAPQSPPVWFCGRASKSRGHQKRRPAEAALAPSCWSLVKPRVPGPTQADTRIPPPFSGPAVLLPEKSAVWSAPTCRLRLRQTPWRLLQRSRCREVLQSRRHRSLRRKTRQLRSFLPVFRLQAARLQCGSADWPTEKPTPRANTRLDAGNVA